MWTDREIEQTIRRLTDKQKASLKIIAANPELPIVKNPHIVTRADRHQIILNAIIGTGLRRLWLIDANGITELGKAVAKEI